MTVVRIISSHSLGKLKNKCTVQPFFLARCDETPHRAHRVHRTHRTTSRRERRVTGRFAPS